MKNDMKWLSDMFMAFGGGILLSAVIHLSQKKEAIVIIWLLGIVLIMASYVTLRAEVK
jgi:hypothetical protein